MNKKLTVSGAILATTLISPTIFADEIDTENHQPILQSTNISIDQQVQSLNSEIETLTQELETSQSVVDTVDRNQLITEFENTESEIQTLYEKENFVIEHENKILTELDGVHNNIKLHEDSENSINSNINELEMELNQKQLESDQLEEQLKLNEKSKKEEVLKLEESINSIEDKNKVHLESVNNVNIEISKLSKESENLKQESVNFENNYYDKLLESNRLTLPDEYINTMMNYFSKPDGETRKKLVSITNKLQDVYYQPHSIDNKVVGTIHDLQKLSNEVIEELNFFALALINDVRKQFGTTTLLQLQRDSLDMAKMVAKLDVGNIGHDVEAIKKSAKQYGLNGEDNYYENAGFRFVDPDSITMNILKQGIFENIRDMLFNDDHVDWGHTISILGYSSEDGSRIPSKYFGLSFSHVTDVDYATVIKNHFIGVRDELIIDHKRFKTDNYDRISPNNPFITRSTLIDSKLIDLNMQLTKLRSLISQNENEIKNIKNNILNINNFNTSKTSILLDLVNKSIFHIEQNLNTKYNELSQNKTILNSLKHRSELLTSSLVSIVNEKHVITDNLKSTRNYHAKLKEELELLNEHDLRVAELIKTLSIKRRELLNIQKYSHNKNDLNVNFEIDKNVLNKNESVVSSNPHEGNLLNQNVVKTMDYVKSPNNMIQAKLSESKSRVNSNEIINMDMEKSMSVINVENDNSSKNTIKIPSHTNNDSLPELGEEKTTVSIIVLGLTALSNLLIFSALQNMKKKSE